VSPASEGPVGAGAGGAGPAAWEPSELQREREAYRRRRTRRSAGIALTSTVVLAAVLVLVVTSSPGWPRVQETFFSWDEARSVFPAVLAGFWMNVRIFLVAAVLVLVVGLAVAILRTLRGPVFFPLRLAAAAYTDVFRGLPLILVILLLGFGVPALRLGGVPDAPVVWGGAALVLTYGAYVAEVIRAGIESVHPSQVAAARSLGLSHAQSLRHVVLPQALRRVVPPLLNDAASLQKDSGLVSILGVIDAVRAAQIETAVSFNYTPYLVAAGLFLLLTIPMVRVTDWVSLRALRRQSAGLR
jgi:polar amino acid transport system permease protein